MLTTDEFSTGSLSSAKPLSMLLPRVAHERLALIGGTETDPVAIALGDDAFKHFRCRTNTNWEGLIVSGIRIEVDEDSVFNPSYEHARLGSVIRRDSELVMRVAQMNFDDQNIFVPLESDLPTLEPGAQVGFRRWQVVLGSGPEKRVMRVFDTDRASSEYVSQ